jgi:GTPase
MVPISTARERERLPVVAIVGRPNVGKSSLLNMLSRRRISIVHPQAGVTRDRISAYVEYEGHTFELWDTGGIGMIDNQQLEKEVQAQIDAAIAKADVLVFVVDAKVGFNPGDQQIAAMLRGIGKPVVLVANKADDTLTDMRVGEFHRHGLGEAMPVSALLARGREELLNRLAKELPETPAALPREELILTIVGRQNVGKSSLVNALAQEERMIVSEVPGTTRDSVDVYFAWENKSYLMIDTAGLKRHSQQDTGVEYFSFHRAQRSIRRADVVLLMMDVSRDIGRTEKHVAGYIEEQGKPCVILVNKWDLSKGIATEQFTHYVNESLRVLSYAPIVYVSVRERKNLAGILTMSSELYDQAGLRVGTGELNRALQDAEQQNLPKAKSGRPRILYGTQVSTHPPSFAVFVNHVEAFTDSYRRYLSTFLRQRFGFKEVPLRIRFRQREGKGVDRVARPQRKPKAG